MFQLSISLSIHWFLFDFDWLKSQVDNMQLGSADRRAYAEKVTMAFWRAMDGDEDEIQGLADEDWNQ